MRRLASLWRRSIQFRVVASTVALATVFISATTWAVAVDVTDSLDAARRASAIHEARVSLTEAQFRLDVPEAARPAAQDRVLQRMVDAVANVPGGPYELVVEGPLGGRSVPVLTSVPLSSDSLPAALRKTVVSRDGTFARYSTVSSSAPSGSGRILVVGGRLQAAGTGDRYALYYLFSLAEHDRIIGLVRQAAFLGVVCLGVHDERHFLHRLPPGHQAGTGGTPDRRAIRPR